MVTNKQIKEMSEELLLKIEDPRNSKIILFKLEEIILTVLLGIMCGYTTWNEYSECGKLNLKWLRKFYPYKNGVASHDTLNRVIGMVKKAEFESLLLKIEGEKVKGIKHIAIDGKKVSKSSPVKLIRCKKENGGKQGTTIVNAYVHEQGMCIGQLCSEKGNELELGIALLKKINLENSIITGDALYACNEIVKTITERKADYVLSLKRNNKISYNNIELIFDEQIECEEFMTEEKSRDRYEIRKIRSIEIDKIDKKCAAQVLQLLNKWNEIKRINEVTRIITRDGKTTNTVMYYIGSMSQNAEFYLNHIRSHWRIENNLHWVLDAQVREDYAKSRTNNASGNLAALRRLAMNLFTLDIDPKKGLKRKILSFNQSKEYRDFIFDFI